VPDREFKNPIFTEFPDVSTQELTDELPGPEEPTRLPQPAETRPATINTATALSRRFLVRRVLIATPLRAGMARSAPPAGSGNLHARQGATAGKRRAPAVHRKNEM
jgi:hypothetical protein